jgi:hypothetical protein
MSSASTISNSVRSSSSAPIVYTYNTIIDLKRRYPYKATMLSWFLDYYKNIVSEDQRNPLFFKTKTYQSFPQNPFHKFKNIKKVNDRWLIGNNNNWNVLESKDAEEREHIQRIIRIKLNQITDRNFTEIKRELLDEIQQMEMFELYDILIHEIYDKFLHEKKFQHDYIHLCYEINQLENLSQKLVTISIDENNQFYWFPNTTNSHFNMNPAEQFYGPFDSEEKVEESIRKNIQFRIQLMKFLEDKFARRHQFIQAIQDLRNNPELEDEDREEKIYKYRREIFGVMEMIGFMYKEKLVHAKLMHVILLHLFQYSDVSHTGKIGTIYSEEIESIIILWKFFAKSLKESTNEKDRGYYDDYIQLFEIIRNHNKDQRLNFLLMDIFESSGSPSSDAVEESKSPDENVDDDWEEELNKEEELVMDSMSELMESRNIEQFIDKFSKIPNNFNKNTKSLIVFTIEHIENSIFRTMWRIVLQQKHTSHNHVLSVAQKLLDNASEWELDIPEFADKCREFIQWF